jgi:hypothetical protein
LHRVRDHERRETIALNNLLREADHLVGPTLALSLAMLGLDLDAYAAQIARE